MLRRHPLIASSSSSSARFFLINGQQKRFFFSGLNSTSSAFLEFSKRTEKSDNREDPPAPPAPTFFPYHKNHLSTKKFHWKEPVKNMLQELNENGMEPTHRLSNWWSLHDPVEPLQKQHQIEYKYMRQIVDDDANHSFQKDAFDNVEDFVLSNENNEFMDSVRFRIRHGVALPSEIAMGRACGFISDSDVEDKEALDLAKRLAPSVKLAPLSFGDWWYFTSALAHGSGIGWNPGKFAAEWEPIRDHLPLGFEPLFDITKEKILVKPEDATKPKSTPGSPAFYYPKRLAKIQDWSKAHIVFIDLAALDARGSQVWNQNWDSFASWSNTDSRLRPGNIFGPPGFNGTRPQDQQPENNNNTKKQSESELLEAWLSSESQQREKTLNRWRHMLCVPKISTFSLAVSTNFSDLVLESLFKKMEQDPNLIVVFQHAGSVARGASAMSASSPATSGGLPDMNLVEQVFLRSLPIHGYTTTVGWQGAFSWIEDVLKTELGFPLDTIPVSSVCTPTTKTNWVIEPGTNRLSQSDDGSFNLDEQLLPKCCFDSDVSVLNSFTSIAADVLVWELTGYHRSMFESDTSGLLDILKTKEGQSNFWKGIPMPTTLKNLRSDHDEKLKKDLKWWSKESAAFPYNYKNE